MSYLNTILKMRNANNIIFALIIIYLTLFSNLAGADNAVKKYDISANLYHSDFLSPELILKPVLLNGISQVSNNKITQGLVNIEIIDTSLGSINLSRIATGDSPTLFETYVLQVLYGASRTVDFYSSLGIKVLPINIELQNPNTPPLAAASGNKVSLLKLKSLEKVAGSSLNIRDSIPMISDIIFHEVTHLIQGKKTGELSSGLLGSTTYEGHANLMTYMISGRTDLGSLPGRPPGMKVHSGAVFGYQITNTAAPTTYNNYEPFSSILVQIHRLVLRKTENVEMTLASHLAVSKVYFNIVMEADGSETYQALAKKIVRDLKRIKLITDVDINSIQIWFLNRGLDLNQSDDEGYTGGLLINNRPPDREDRWLKKETLSSNSATPIIQIQSQFFKLNRTLKLPIMAVLSSEHSLPLANKFMNEKLAATLQMNPNPSAEQVQHIFIQGLIEAAKSGVDLGGVTVLGGVAVIDEKTRLIKMQATKSKLTNCSTGEILVAPLTLFDATGINFGQLTLPFICK